MMDRPHEMRFRLKRMATTRGWYSRGDSQGDPSGSCQALFNAFSKGTHVAAKLAESLRTNLALELDNSRVDVDEFGTVLVGNRSKIQVYARSHQAMRSHRKLAQRSTDLRDILVVAAGIATGRLSDEVSRFFHNH